jgi:tripeptidyl-peptidase-1
MMRFIPFLLVLVSELAVFGTAAALPSSYVVHESRTVNPRNWEKTSKVNSSLPIIVRIGLTPSNLDKAEDSLINM